VRTLTFLFADLREYTTFVERHGDVAATTLIADYRRLVRGEVAKAKGAEIKTEGDSFYVVFEAATDAVRCAVSILREADRYSRDRPDRPMRVGAGIHAGEPQPHEGQYVGGAVIVAARLAQTASAGELLVSDVVRGLLPKGTAPTMQEREGLTLKGIADAPRAFTVSWAAPEPARAEPPVVSVEAAAPSGRAMLCPRVIGRDTELTALRALLDEASGGRGRTVLVAGEAGVGKSALLREFLEHATSAGARTLRGECTEVEARRPFGPLIDAFVAGSLPLPPELSQGGPGALPVAELERYRVHGAFSQALAELAANATVVVAIEDVHWADSATLELLPYLTRKLRDHRVLVVGTYRDDELHRLHPLRATLAELKRLRLVTEIRLPGLGTDEVAAMIKETLRLGRAPTTAFREAIQERCEGNPFFIEEVLRTLVERGDLEYREGAWRRTKDVAELAIPDSVRDAVQQRLATLTPTARRVLQVAAVIGQRFVFDLLLRVTEVREGDLLDALREAIEAQLIVEEADAADEAYRFRHALTRESVIAELMRREQKVLHLEVAQALESSATDPESRVEELAYHFDRGGDEKRALRYHDLAARGAERALAFRREADHLERAIELAAAEREVGHLQLRLARAAHSSRDLARAIRAAEAARATFRAAGDAQGEGEALAHVGWIRFRSGGAAAGEHEIQQGIALLEPFGLTERLARAYAFLARLAALEQRPNASELGLEAIAMSEQVGDPGLLVMSKVSLATALATGGKTQQSLEMFREAVRFGRERGLPLAADGAYHNWHALLMFAGAPAAEVHALHAERVEHARAHGIRGDALLASETSAAYRRGDWDEALRLVEEGRSDDYLALARAGIEARIVLARGGPDAATPLLDEVRASGAGRTGPQDVAGRAAFAAGISALLGDPRRALDSAALLADLEIDHPARHIGVAAAIWAALALSDSDATRRWVEVGKRRPPELGHGPAAGTYAFAEGALAFIVGDVERALERYLASARAFEEFEWQFIESATLVRRMRAELLLERGDRAGARAEIEAVVRRWRKVGATWYIGQLRAWAAERGIELSEAATATA